MAKIHSLKVRNFKSLNNFDQVFGAVNFICLIGRGDSGKTTIIEAIAAVLSPNWNLAFYDTDFYNGNIDEPIEIEVTLYELPEYLIQESKYGLYVRGFDMTTNLIHDEIRDHHQVALTIRLKVEKDLEPIWHVITGRPAQEPIEIRASDRARLNAFIVSDYIDRHFSWSKGNPLYSLLKEEGNSPENTSVITDSLREAKKKIDAASFDHLDNVVDRIKTASAHFGIELENTINTIDNRDISIKDGKISLHADKIPFRQKGKGSKRLISIAIQTELAKSGGILLVDEIEQGLEPDRAQHLANYLKSHYKGQVFLTTHSRDVLVELNARNIFKIVADKTKLYQFYDNLQACVRSNPEAFFAKRIIVCEGLTEIGICRALNTYRLLNGVKSMATLGVRLANGAGSNQIAYAKGFLEAGFDVCLFCDSDVSEINDSKPRLRDLGIVIIDCDINNSTETQIFNDLPWNGVCEIVKYQIEQIEEAVEDSVRAYYRKCYGELPSNWLITDSPEIRVALGETAKSKKWFKRTDHGEFLGEICCKYSSQMDSRTTVRQLSELSNWLENA